MGDPNYSVRFTADTVAAAAVAVGDAIVFDSAQGAWVAATAANRTSLGKRAEGVALTAYGGSVIGKIGYQTSGILAASITGLSSGYGSRALVRVTSAGRLERVALASLAPATDDVVGYAEPDGRVHLWTGLPFNELISIYSNAAPMPGVTSLEDHGAVGDGVTDDSAALAAAVAAVSAGTYGSILVGAKTYLINTGVTLPAGCSLIGCGRKSVLKTTANITVLTVGGEQVCIADLNIEGNRTGAAQRGVSCGNTAVAGSGVSKLTLDNVHFREINQYGFFYAQNPLVLGTNQTGPSLVNCLAYHCGTGYRLDTRGEYCRLTNCHADYCDTGVYKNSGNNAFANCHIVRSQSIGVEVDGGTNTAHSEWVGCAINHNQVTALKVGALLYAEKFVGCSMYEGAVTFTNTIGCIFVGCQIDVASYTLSTAVGIRFIGCLLDSLYANTVTVDTVSKVEWVECRKPDGTIPSWVGAQDQVNFTFAADADEIPSKQKSMAKFFIVNNGVISTTRKITVQQAPEKGRTIYVKNDNAQSIQFAWATGSAVTLTTGQRAIIGTDGTNAMILMVS